MRRIGCILVPDFSLAALVRCDPELLDRPVALMDSVGPAGRPARFTDCRRVVAVSPRAEAAGVRPGMIAAEARAVAPRVVLVEREPAIEASAARALLEVAESFSPLVEPGRPGQVWLDLGGLGPGTESRERPLGPRAPAPSTVSERDDDEKAYAAELRAAQEILARLRKAGLEASLGVAASKEVAALAARCGAINVIAPGREEAFLKRLPLEHLDPGRGPEGEELEVVFKRWGIRRLGELARLNLGAVGSRLGRRGVELIRTARGESRSPFIARLRAEEFGEQAEFEPALESLEPLVFAMRAMLERLAARLAPKGLALSAMTLSLALSGRRIEERRVALPAPTVEVRLLLSLLRMRLEAAPSASAVEAVRLTAEPCRARPVQAQLFAPPSAAPTQLAAALARLALLDGAGRVGMPVVGDSYRPEAVELRPFTPPGPKPPALAAQPGAGIRLTLRAIRPALEVEVACCRDRPEFIRGRRLCARVIIYAGPWRLQGEWWRAGPPPAPIAGGAAGDAALQRQAGPLVAGAHAGAYAGAAPLARDYYDLALAGGPVYRAFRELANGRWYLDGVYD